MAVHIVIHVEVNEAGFSELASRLPDKLKTNEMIGRWIERAQLQVQRGTLMEAPVATGNMRRSITFDAVDYGGLVGHVGVYATEPDGRGYAAYVEFGTAPHVIVAKNRKVMRFADSSFAITNTQAIELGVGPRGTVRRTGQLARGHNSLYIFSGTVHHPGTTANPFFERAIRDSEDPLNRLMEVLGQQMLGSQQSMDNIG